MDLDAYCARIGYTGPRRAGLATLHVLHRLHVQCIPFETLAAFGGETPLLDSAALQAKLVASRRGGWCFEHNLLFRDVLCALGFQVTCLAARVLWTAGDDARPARTHMLLLVDVEDGRYVADVGFGRQTLTAPLRLETDTEQMTTIEPARIVAHGQGYAVQCLTQGSWRSLYGFDLQPQELADYEVTNWYLAHSPRSPFTSSLIASRVEGVRRHALRDRHYSRYDLEHGSTTVIECEIANVAELARVLKDSFLIDVPESAALATRLRALF